MNSVKGEITFLSDSTDVSPVRMFRLSSAIDGTAKRVRQIRLVNGLFIGACFLGF